MQGDLALAAGLLEGARKAQKTFARRFEDEATVAFQHCVLARQAGLSFEDYMAAVSRAAARSLLSLLPRREADIEFHRHVRRVLGRRDFALVALMLQGDDAAWTLFLDRYDSYLETILVRSGCDPDEIEFARDELVDALRGSEGALSPLADWLGRSDLRHWLLCYVREVFRGGTTIEAVDDSDAPRRHSVTQSGRTFIASVEAEFAAAWTELSRSKRDLLRQVARGLPLDGEPDEIVALSARHETVLDDLWTDFVRRVARAGQASRRDIDELLRETFVGETESELARLGQRTEFEA